MISPVWQQSVKQRCRETELSQGHGMSQLERNPRTSAAPLQGWSCGQIHARGLCVVSPLPLAQHPLHPDINLIHSLSPTVVVEGCSCYNLLSNRQAKGCRKPPQQFTWEQVIHVALLLGPKAGGRGWNMGQVFLDLSFYPTSAIDLCLRLDTHSASPPQFLHVENEYTSVFVILKFWNAKKKMSESSHKTTKNG
jgi:hypothetical protein